MKSRLYGLILTISITLFQTTPAVAREGVAVTLPDKRVAILAEGDLESASAGSYSVAIFKDEMLLDFEAGAVFSRDGSFFQDDGKPRVMFADITGDGNKELILSRLTAGSGNYLEVDALDISGSEIRMVARVQSDTTQDVVSVLKAACEHGACLP